MNPLVIIPTYNEKENITQILAHLHALAISLDILFIDDDSPDGSGQLLDQLAAQHPHLRVLHRAKKEGIGSAHQAGLAYARTQGYETVITMDCDLTHSASDIPRFLESPGDVVVGSRYLQKDSLSGWNWRRKFLTCLAHSLTQRILHLPYDSTGAYRLYRLRNIPASLFSLVQSQTYPFFYESLFILHCNKLKITEIPITLPPRTYGSSKMPITEPFRGLRHLLAVGLRYRLKPEAYRIPKKSPQFDATIEDQQGWDDYWDRATSKESLLYQIIAFFYRRFVIAPRFKSSIENSFRLGASLLHAGCGSGQVDVAIQNHFQITAIDSSRKALELYAQTVSDAFCIRQANILNLPFPDDSFDGIYNLGVMEHFHREDLKTILSEFRRVLRPGGHVFFFWPHARATSVAVLSVWHTLRRKIFGDLTRLHPEEVSLVKSRSWMKNLLQECGFTLRTYQFDGGDFWVQAIITAEAVEDPQPPSP